MKRIIRNRHLTPEEVEGDNKIRERVEAELSELIERHRQRMENKEKPIDCADCGKIILDGHPIYWMGTSARCFICHAKRMGFISIERVRKALNDKKGMLYWHNYTNGLKAVNAAIESLEEELLNNED